MSSFNFITNQKTSIMSLKITKNSGSFFGLILTLCLSVLFIGNVQAQDNACDTVTIVLTDSYGDGWNGNVVTITSEVGDVLLTGTLDSGSEGTLSFGLNFDGDCGPVFGCTDVNALNYNEEATADDGSCQYPVSGCTDSLAVKL